ncbi:MAG: translation initiation factor IF-2 [Clostridiales bacterium]|nr:translation initiation factor IF-2 [Clostridiales bacterium]
MDNATTNNVNTNEDANKNAKRLFALVESSELQDCIKRIIETKRRVEKLFSAERAKLSDLAAERIRQEQEAEAAQRAAELEAERAIAQSTNKTSEPAEASEVKASEPISVPTEKDAPVTATQNTVTPAPTPAVEQQPAAESTGGTRTAIPSYIRGVIKHTPRPAQEKTARGDRMGTRPTMPPRDRNGAHPSSPRPTGGNAPRSSSVIKFDPPAAQRNKREVAGKKTTVKPEDKRQMNKRTLIRKGYIQENMDEERMGTRKLKNKKVNKVVPFTPIKIEKAVITTENLTVKILSEKIGKTAQEIIKQLMELGIMTNINSVVDFATMQLVADALGVSIELKLEKTKEEELLELHSEPDAEEDLVKRPPIITVMGHVDHGKTSLLDAIRKTSVVSGEAGGITQHIGAYSVDLNGEKITFLDTPGHEAFTEMRRRGAKVTDIAVLIVAADDGVMPQTVEAIKHAKEADVPIVVAINKVDKPGANIEKIKEQLAEKDLICEEWGGQVPMIPISAKQNKGIDKLLENIILQAEVLELRANPKRSARGYVIEARLDKGRGAVATVIIQNGTLKVGDYVVSGTTYGRVRSLIDDKGKTIKSAGPSMPVAVYGLEKVPSAGDPIAVVENEKMARQVIEERSVKLKNEMLADVPQANLDVFGDLENKTAKELKLVIKADVQGSSEALKEALTNLSNDEVTVTVVKTGVGAINQSDIMMAEVSHASIIGFNVKPDNDAKTAAERAGIEIKLFSIIYEAMDHVQSKIEDMLAPKFVERVTGKAIVRAMFKVSGVGLVGGSYVQSGKIVRNGKARLYRNGKLIHDGNIVGLKRFKDDAKEVTIGLECGIAIADCNEYLEDDIIECYVVEKESK